MTDVTQTVSDVTQTVPASTTSGDPSKQILIAHKQEIKFLIADGEIQCQVCGNNGDSDGLCDNFDDNGNVEICGPDHACFFVYEGKLICKQKF